MCGTTCIVTTTELISQEIQKSMDRGKLVLQGLGFAREILDQFSSQCGCNELIPSLIQPKAVHHPDLLCPLMSQHVKFALVRRPVVLILYA